MTPHSIRRVESFSHDGPTQHTITFEKSAGHGAPRGPASSWPRRAPPAPHSLPPRHVVALQVDARGDDANPSHSSPAPAPHALDRLRRTSVAVAGGALTVAGIVLIPCPVVPGALVSYGGLLLLATEFEAAQRAVEAARAPVEKWLEDDDDKKDGASRAPQDDSADSAPPTKPNAMKEMLRKLLIGDRNKERNITDEHLVPLG